MTLASGAEAALNLTATPISGGSNSLRFGRIDSRIEVNREVRLRITATENTQYQLYQRIVEPLANQQGQSIGRNALISYGIAGSNGAGTLYAQSPEPMTMSDQLVYTSNGNGDSDSLIMVYSVRPEEISASGSFFGKIYYTLRPVGSGRTDTVILNVYLDAENQFKAEIEGSSSPDLIRISADEHRNEHIQVDIAGNGGGQVRIYHELEQPLENALFEGLQPRTIKVNTMGSTAGELFARTPQDVTRKPILLYRSDEPADSFRVYYDVDEKLLAAHTAGTYEGKLNMVVETSSGRQSFPVRLELTVEPVFDLNITLPPDGVRFNNLMPDAEPMLRDVQVEVISNMGRPYMVVQNVLAPLTNQDGVAIEESKFQMRQTLTEGEGKVQNGSFATVTAGDSTVFISDGQGSPATFKVQYRLEPYRSIKAGDYATSVRYSLSEL